MSAVQCTMSCNEYENLTVLVAQRPHENVIRIGQIECCRFVRMPALNCHSIRALRQPTCQTPKTGCKQPERLESKYERERSPLDIDTFVDVG